MAYASLVSLSQILNQVLHHDQCHVLIEHDGHNTLQIIQSLQENVSSLQSFLNDFPPNVTMNMEERIRDAAIQGEDIIENFISSELRLKYCSKKFDIMDLTKISLPCHKQLPSHHKFEQLHHNVSEVSQKIVHILEEVKEIKIRHPIIENRTQPELGGSNAAGSSRSMPKQSGEDLMVGFEDDLMEIRARLCGGSSKCEIIPIVGIGGSGKTTLARYLYDDELIVENFYFRAWVTIPPESQVKNILIRYTFDKEAIHIAPAYELTIQQLYKMLKRRKYLIVLDDIWDGEAWDLVKRALPEVNNGSRVILTTRISEIADYVDSDAPLHRIRPLNDNQSWDLIKKKVFLQNPCPPELEEIGKTIARNCKGLPLAITIIGGVLSIETTPVHWKYVAEDWISALSNSGDDLFDLLNLSFTQLPHHLKPCFLHLGTAFPEDYSICASDLTKLWIAEGFIEPNFSKSQEEVAEEYLEDLVKKNLVLVISRGYNGRIYYSSIHDILRDWCMKRAQEERFLVHVCRRNPSISHEEATNHRRIFIGSIMSKYSYKNICESQTHTIMSFVGDKKLTRSLRRIRMLRVIQIVVSNNWRLFSNIVELFQLRYLCITFRKSVKKFKLTGSIAKLINLQTLIFYGIKDRLYLPIEIWEMPQLTHIHCTRSCFLPVPSPRIINGRRFLLQNLQILSEVQDLACITELVNVMPNLKELGLIYLAEIRKMQRAVNKLKDLGSMTQLETLRLCLKIKFYTDEDFSWDPSPLMIHREALPVSLRSLTLKGCQFDWKSMAIVGSLPNLEVLEIQSDAFVGEEWRTKDGEFCRLKVLVMTGINIPPWIVAESNHFPSLKRLCLNNVRNLEEIPATIGGIPTLEMIEVKYYKGLRSPEASARKILEEQQSLGNSLLQVRIHKLG